MWFEDTRVNPDCIFKGMATHFYFPLFPSQGVPPLLNHDYSAYWWRSLGHRSVPQTCMLGSISLLAYPESKLPPAVSLKNTGVFPTLTHRLVSVGRSTPDSSARLPVSLGGAVSKWEHELYPWDVYEPSPQVCNQHVCLCKNQPENTNIHSDTGSPLHTGHSWLYITSQRDTSVGRAITLKCVLTPKKMLLCPFNV